MDLENLAHLMRVANVLADVESAGWEVTVEDGELTIINRGIPDEFFEERAEAVIDTRLAPIHDDIVKHFDDVLDLWERLAGITIARRSRDDAERTAMRKVFEEELNKLRERHEFQHQYTGRAALRKMMKRFGLEGS